MAPFDAGQEGDVFYLHVTATAHFGASRYGKALEAAAVRG